MVIGFGETTKVTDLPDGGILIERTTVRDYKTHRQRRYYAEQVRVDDFDELRQQINEAIDQAEAGKCLDLTLEVMISQETGKPRLLTKTLMDVGSKL